MATALHLFANFKWTGPADPAIRTAIHLRRLGLDVVFAEAAWTLPGAEHRMAKELQKAHMPVIAGLELRKHFSLFSAQRDRRRLAARLVRGDFDVLHCHLLADHLIGALAKHRARARRRVLLVRSLYDAHAPRRTWRTRLAFRHTDGVIAPTRAVAHELVERFELPEQRVLWLEPPTEPWRAQMTGDLRERLGITREQIAIGITARIQPHRRFELLWETARLVVNEEPRACFVLLGRGNARDTRELVTEPIERLQLAPFVVLPGYLHEPEYSLALRSLDLFCFLVPGSDGTCRAVREAMALGLPTVASRRGMLETLLAPAPEYGIVDACGIVAEETPAQMAAALLTLIREPERRARLGAAARRKAADIMDPVVHAASIAAFYEFLREEVP